MLSLVCGERCINATLSLVRQFWPSLAIIQAMTIFDGYHAAQQREKTLKQAIDNLAVQGKKLKIAAILYTEDQGSTLYTRLKQEAAQRVGIDYEVHTFSMRDGVEPTLAQLRLLNEDPSVTGIIIQKPWRRTWIDVTMVDDTNSKAVRQAFDMWWHLQTSQIQLAKDVDGLHPSTLETIAQGTWAEQGRVLPATAKAVLEIIKENFNEGEWSTLARKKTIILGKSDILGQPLFYELKNRGVAVEMIGSADLRQRVVDGRKLLDADIIVSATGQAKLITGDLVKAGVIVIDVGEPKGDVDFESVAQKAAFITPVPGGVGPMTVVCLLENCVALASN